MIHAAAAGEVLIDITTTGISENGYPILQTNPGGAPANFLAAMAAQGLNTAFIGKVGDDMFGHMLKDTLRQFRIDTRGLITDKNVFTTLAFVKLDQNGDRSFSFARKPGADTCLREDEIMYSVIDEAMLFHFGTLSFTHEPSRTAVQKAVLYAKKQGKLLSFDPNYRAPLWQEKTDAIYWIKQGLALTDIVKISEEELFLLYSASLETAAEQLLADFPNIKTAFITLGEKGCLFKTKNFSGTVPSYPAKTIDTTGAGDIFGGTAVALLLKSGKELEALSFEELKFVTETACAVAARSTEKSGGIFSVPNCSDS